METPVMGVIPHHCEGFVTTGKVLDEGQRKKPMKISKPACARGMDGRLIGTKCLHGECGCRLQQWMLIAATSKRETKKEREIADQRAQEHADKKGIEAIKLPITLPKAAIRGYGLFENATTAGVWGQDGGGDYIWRARRVLRFAQYSRDIISHQGAPVALRTKDNAEDCCKRLNIQLRSGRYAWVTAPKDLKQTEPGNKVPKGGMKKNKGRKEKAKSGRL